jgi:hypothetical protein
MKAPAPRWPLTPLEERTRLDGNTACGGPRRLHMGNLGSMHRIAAHSTALFVVSALVCMPILTGCSASDGNAEGRDGNTTTSVTVSNAIGRGRSAAEESSDARLFPATRRADKILQDAYNNRQSGLQVRGEGTVAQILSDDLEGPRHQRFILRLSTGQTVLIAHNIDVASRIGALREGDTVGFHGEYEWNSEGGVVHWTHHDPSGRHIGGSLRHKGKTYQ